MKLFIVSILFNNLMNGNLGMKQRIKPTNIKHIFQNLVLQAHTLLSLLIFVCLAVFLDTMLEVLLMLGQSSGLQ